MTYLAKTGSFNTGTGAAASTVSVTGVGFQPKAIIFWWSTSTTTGTTDATTGATINMGVGFATSSSARNCRVTQSQDAQASSSNNAYWFNDACIAITAADGSAIDGLLDFTSFDADGFTLTVDNQFSASYHVSYLALGGTDITNVFTATATTSASTGAVATTGVGFQGDVFLAWTGLGTTSAARSYQGDLSFGAATGSSNRGITTIWGRSGQADMQTASYGFDGEVIGCPATFTESQAVRADFTSFNADGFTLNYLEGDSGCTFGYLIIKGGRWSVGNLATRADGNDIAVTGLAFAPSFGLFSSHGLAKSTQDTLDGHARISIGAFDSTTSRVSQAIIDVDAAATSLTTYSVQHDAVYINLDTADAVQGLMDIKSIETDGFTCVMDDADPSAAFVWYLTGGAAEEEVISTPTSATEFTSIKIEAYISSAWVDITADVLQNSPSWNMGIMGNSPLDRVGDPEVLKFALRNGENNSSGLLGYYTPGHPNCRSGWGVGIPVRLVFVYEGQSYYKYYGRIAPDGIQTEPLLWGERSVSVSCEGFMALADRHTLELMTLQTEININQAVVYILANMPVQPLMTEYGNPIHTFPTVFDTLSSNTSASSEFQKLATSEWGRIYTRGDVYGGQTLVAEGKGDRTNTGNTPIPVDSGASGFMEKEDGDYLLLETGDKIILSIATTVEFDNIAMQGVKVEYGANLANYIIGTSYPRRVDAAATTVLFATQRRIYVESGTTVSNIRGRYRDPDGAATYVNGTDMVTPLSGTDYTATANEDGTGASLTANISVTAAYGVEQVDYSISNSGGSGAWVYLQARGKGIYLYDPIDKIFADTTSGLQYGRFPLNVSMPYQDDPLVVDSICANLLTTEKDPYTTVDAYPLLANRSVNDMFAFLVLEPGARARFAEPMTGIDANYFINGYSAKIINNRYVIWSPVLQVADDTQYWRLDVSALDTETILDT